MKKVKNLIVIGALVTTSVISIGNVILQDSVFCNSFHGDLEWQNPADRYMNVYKDYMDSVLSVRHDGIRHFVYFARDRESMVDHPFLEIPYFVGAQIMYPWKNLEPQEGQYDFSMIEEDYEYLKKNGKKLFIQLQDATFNPNYSGVPEYLLTKEYDGGTIHQRNESGTPEGWVAKRWNTKVQERFSALLVALGDSFDGKIEGINLQETAIGVSNEYDYSFSPEQYVLAIKTNMFALKSAFPTSVTMQYANFMPGEWLPWNDSGYLRAIYQYGENIGVGLGAPDLLVEKRAHLNHALAMMHESKYSVPLGIAVQDGNYIGKTGTDEILRERNNIVPLLHAFAKHFLKVNYMFWSNQNPYFQEDVIPYFIKE